MIVTVLASLFLLMLIGLIFYGYGFIMKSTKGREGEESERCFLCKTSYRKDKLVLRAVGDSKLVYFCRDCIAQLASDSSKL